MFQMSDTIGKLAAALAKAQGEMGVAIKDAANPHFRSKYATLDAVTEAIKAPLSKNAISYSQHAGAIVDGAIEITTFVAHGESGEWMRSTMAVPLGKRDAQGLGSALSYGKRYALMSVFGVPADDDDGNAASAPQPQRRPIPDHVRNHPHAPPEIARDDADEREPVDFAEVADGLITIIDQCKTKADLADFKATERFRAEYQMLPPEHRKRVGDAGVKRAALLDRQEAA